MPKFSICKSILIKAPMETVHASVRDFKQWPAWSPWLIAEPDSKLSYSDDGMSYAWDGQITGSGNMEITSDDAPHAIHYQLIFLKPWKSTSDVTFTFKEANGGTEVTWTMNGSLPIFMFWMKKMMAAFIGMDYERGLMMLGQHIEQGKVLSKLEFPGVQEYPGCQYVGIRNSCSVDELKESMQRDLAKLGDWKTQSEPALSGKMLSTYHKWDPVKQLVDYTLALPVESPPPTTPDGMTQGNIPACRCYVVRHIGPYRQLGNAWSSAVMHSRARIFKQSRKVIPFETYENSPDEVDETELVTLVHFPVKT